MNEFEQDMQELRKACPELSEKELKRVSTDLGLLAACLLDEYFRIRREDPELYAEIQNCAAQKTEPHFRILEPGHARFRQSGGSDSES